MITNFEIFENQKNDKQIVKCPVCNYEFDYLSIPESGMGYIKCPKCNTPLTQKNIK